jgi:hypothetical protein
MLAGMRIEPPPSPAYATGTMPLATAAADPPLEPPELRVGPRDCVGPCDSARPSASARTPVFALPMITNPARSSFWNK